MSKQFIIDNYDYTNMLFDSYSILNGINIPPRLKKFPYNLLQATVRPTYNEISLEHIKGRTFHKRGGMISPTGEVLVFMY